MATLLISVTWLRILRLSANRSDFIGPFAVDFTSSGLSFAVRRLGFVALSVPHLGFLRLSDWSESGCSREPLRFQGFVPQVCYMALHWRVRLQTALALAVARYTCLLCSCYQPCRGDLVFHFLSGVLVCTPYRPSLSRLHSCIGNSTLRVPLCTHSASTVTGLCVG